MNRYVIYYKERAPNHSWNMVGLRVVHASSVNGVLLQMQTRFSLRGDSCAIDRVRYPTRRLFIHQTGDHPFICVKEVA